MSQPTEPDEEHKEEHAVEVLGPETDRRMTDRRRPDPNPWPPLYNPVDGHTKGLWTPSGKRLCHLCKQLRSAEQLHHFGPCIFCMVEQAKVRLTSLESTANSIVPKGRHLLEVCTRCKVPNWWINLELFTDQYGDLAMWCVTCRGDNHVQRWFSETKGIKHFDEAGKLKRSDLDDLLADMEI